jgi:hypothetical protein
VFDGAKPKLVAFTRLVLLSSPQAPGHRSQNS